jgi:hypothetical protein
MVCFLIFPHCKFQTVEDLNDMIDNIKHYHKDCDFIVNHPTIIHPKVRTRHNIGIIHQCNMVYGVFIEMVRSLTEEDLNKYDHYCMVAANQYFINNIEFKPNVNYFQFYNSDNWDNTYTGIKTPKIIGNFLKQPYGVWDQKEMYKIFDIKTPMVSNWECGTMTSKTMRLCKENLEKSIELYPNLDLVSLFPGYMALKSEQEWDWPKFFATFDPSCKEKNWILTTDQVCQKHNEGYFSVKRVNYSKDCPIKQFIRNQYGI